MRHFAKHPTYFFVYIYLCKLGSEKTKWYWHPTTVAKITGLSRPTVNAAFKALEEDEFLIKTHKSSSNTYYSFTREPLCIYLEFQLYETPDVNYGFSKMVRPATPQDLTATTSSTSQPPPSGEPFAFTPKKKTGSVYAIKDKETQEIIYIGQTKDFAQRKQQHLNMIDHGTALWYPQAREDGYSSNKVEITILQDFMPDNIEERSKKEKELILKYKPKYNTQYLK